MPSPSQGSPEPASTAAATAGFRCQAGCDGQYPVDQVIYRCPRCGELLQVAHDLGRLADRPASAWRELFERRYLAAELPYGSGVWGKREWVMPHLRDASIVSLGEGATPLVPLPRYARELGVGQVLVKQCGQSPTGSFKDLGMTVLVSVVNQMVADGKPAGAPIRAIACASTGDTSASLAAYCAAAGLRALVILPRGKVSTAQLLQPLCHGARVLALDTDFDGCMAIVRRLSEEPGIYLANSLNSLRLEGQKTVALEMAQQLGWEVPDWVIVPGGNLGNVAALAAGFEMLRALSVCSRVPRLVVAQAERANPLYRAFQTGFREVQPVQAGTTLASAIQIGNPVSVRRAIAALQRTGGLVEQATESELAEAAARVDRHGLLADPHTGVALAALEKLAARGEVKAAERVAVISTASGLKFTDFKLGYHEGTLESVPAAAAGTTAHRNLPVELPSDYDRVRDAALRALD